MEEVVAMAGDFEFAVLHTSTPSFENDCKIAEALKEGLGLGWVILIGDADDRDPLRLKGEKDGMLHLTGCTPGGKKIDQGRCACRRRHRRRLPDLFRGAALKRR